MGFLVKFILLFTIIYFLLKAISRWLIGARGFNRRASSPYGQSREAQKEPETQEERILDYQRKSFESADAVDVEFEEIKRKDSM